MAILVALVEDRLHTLYKHLFQYIQIDPITSRTGFGFSIPDLKVSVNRRTLAHLSVYTVEMAAITEGRRGTNQEAYQRG